MHSKRSIFWIIGLTLITILIFYFGREEILGLLIKANPKTMGGLFLLQIYTLGLTAFQWHLMLKKAGATCSPGRETEPDQNVILEKSAGKIYQKFRTIIAFTKKASANSRYLVNFRERIALIIISTLIWSLYPLKVYIVCRMLFIDVDFLTVAMVTYTAYMISMVPLLPGGLGSFEGSMALLF